MGNEQRSIAAKLMFIPIVLQVQMFLYDEREENERMKGQPINNAGAILANAQGPSKSFRARAALALAALNGDHSLCNMEGSLAKRDFHLQSFDQHIQNTYIIVQLGL